MNRIVCVGNPFIQGDDFGARVHERLIQRSWPDDVQVIDGGIAGLNLLNVFDDCERLIFVDSVAHDAASDAVLVLQGDELVTSEAAYHHASGLGYVLQADKAIRSNDFPRVFLVGAGAQANDDVVAEAAQRCAQLALESVSSPSEI